MRQADAGFDLALRRRLDAGADDLGRVGAEVDHHREERRGRFDQLHAGRRQAEEDEEQLHDERRVADQLDVGADDAGRAMVGPKVRADAPAVAERDAGDGRHRRQPQREDHALQQHGPVGQQDSPKSSL